MKTALILFFVSPFILSGAGKDSCVECHSALDGDLQKPAVLIKQDVHKVNGLSCVNCHGGDANSDDPSVAMDPKKGFLGKPARFAIPKLCANCHSSPDFMRKYRPRQRVDQYELYQTSVHGKRLAAHDENVATCIDCHSVHDIREVKDAMSPTYPLHVPETCSRCHADQQKMAKYGIPANQFADYRVSVHWQALSKGGDLSAPTCVSCHGNHGAKPPDVENVAAVCGSCHVLFAQLYNGSVHKPLFSEAPHGGGCMVCHTNHAIHKPSTAMLAGPNAVCSGCHEVGSAGANAASKMAESINGLDEALKHSEAVLASADKYGMEVSEAQVRLMEGRENLVKARLAVHSFNLGEVRKPIDAGQNIARETLQAGQLALHEKDVRRFGLGISVILIAIVMIAIRVLLKRMEAAAAGLTSDFSKASGSN
jgi:hypothetical protein